MIRLWLGLILVFGSVAAGLFIRATGNSDNLYLLLAAFMLGAGILIGVLGDED